MFIVPCLEEGIVGEARPNNIIVIMIVKIITIIIMIAKIITMIINISPEARPSCCQALRCRLDISRGCDLPEDWKKNITMIFVSLSLFVFFSLEVFLFSRFSRLVQSYLLPIVSGLQALKVGELSKFPLQVSLDYAFVN